MAQNNNTETFTAPLAVIKINGYNSGYMRSLSFTENIGRATVRGIGSLPAQEKPAITHDCTLNAGFFFISFARPEMRALINRDLGKDQLLNTLIFGENPTQIHVYRKQVVTRENGIVTGVEPEGEPIAIIRDFFVESQSFDMQEGGITGSNISGTYLTPVFTNE